jgi:hypothetical protein
MKPLNVLHYVSNACRFGIALSMVVTLVGCEEANVALDNLIGRKPVVVTDSQSLSAVSVVPAKKRTPGELPAAPTPQAEPGAKPKPQDTGSAQQKAEPAEQQPMAGKKRKAGALAPPPPTAPSAVAKVDEMPPPPPIPPVKRDPFKAPTEILPTECPPSMPLCRFDRSQLKLVGVIQVEDGNFKALVEDPDGRGYFISSGMQIGNATVTQVTNRGMTLRVAKTLQDVQMPLFKEAKDVAE